MSEIHARTCHICEANCGTLMTVEGNKVTKVTGNPDHVLSRGYICPKATAIPDIQDDPDRLRVPIKKIDNDWKEVTWAEAFSDIAKRHKSILEGKKTSAIFAGNPNVHNYSSSFFMRGLKKAWGVQGIYSASTLDQIPHMVCQKWVYGHNALYPVPDIDRTMYMLCVGGNPLASNGSLWTVPDVKNRIKELQDRGGKFIVVDPRKTETAKLADEHYHIKPGTDTAFFIGLLLALDKYNLINPRHLIPHLKDWDKAMNFLRRFSIEGLSSYCGISTQTILSIGKQLGSGKPAIVYGRMGVSVTKHGTLNHWLIQLLNIATGNVDNEGGVMFPDPVIDPVERSGTGSYARYHQRVSGRPEVLGELPAAELASEITTKGDGQIGALLTIAANPVLSAPGGRQIDLALESLELMVSIDMYITETSRHADYILPPCGPLEKDHYPLFFAPLAIRNYVDYSPALFEKEENSFSDWEIMADLTDALLLAGGNTPQSLRVSPPELLDQFLRSSKYEINLAQLKSSNNGHDLGPLKRRLPERLKTEDKLIHCAPDIILEDLKLFEKSFKSPRVFSFSLIGRRHLRSNNSWMHNSRRLIKGPNRCTLMMHPEDAAMLGIDNKELVEVYNKIGSLQLPVEITEDIMQSVVSIPHGYGHGRKGVKLTEAQKAPGVSINDLTDPSILDNLSGNAVLNNIPVEIRKIQSTEV